MNIKTKIVALLLTVSMMFIIMPTNSSAEDTASLKSNQLTAQEIVESGSCGEGTTWTLDNEGTLTISGNGVIKIGAFEENLNIKTVIIEEGVCQIYSSAFRCCANVEKIVIPNSINTIGNGAFSGCEKITTAGPIGSNCDLEFGWIEIIPDEAFSYFSELTSVLIPKTIQHLGTSGYYTYNVFEGCNNLSSIEVEEGSDYFQSIDGVLYDKSLWTLVKCPQTKTTVELPETIRVIGSQAFDCCKNLESIILPETVNDIRLEAFNCCYKLKKIVIPDGVEEIRQRTFSGCGALTDVTIPDSVTRIEQYAFYYCESLSEIVIPDSVQYIGSGVFYGTALKSVVLPKKIESIENDLFHNCSNLDHVVIPVSVTEIKDNAFSWCFNLIDIYYYGTADDWKEIIIGKNNDLDDVTIHYNYIPCNHVWDSFYTVDKEATCKNEGSESIHCSKCGEIQAGSSRSINKTEHKYIWKTEIEATCTTTGSEKGICSVCGDDTYREIPITHSWNNYYTVDTSASCVKEGVESIHCAKCNAKKNSRMIPKTEHIFGNKWKVSVPATELKSGVSACTCKVCGAVKTKTIAKLAPTLSAVKIKNLKAAKKKMTVNWKKVSKKKLKKIKKIQIQYSTDKTFKTAVRTKYIKAKNTSCKIKGLNRGKMYYVRLRAYTKLGSTVHVSKWSSKKSVTVK